MGSRPHPIKIGGWKVRKAVAILCLTYHSIIFNPADYDNIIFAVVLYFTI